ncbi:MAG: hypothetical protein JNK72_01435 [Myxococcales bacterium]|nr:hypothetical protein [Myxococcales bacterium]
MDAPSLLSPALVALGAQLEATAALVAEAPERRRAVFDEFVPFLEAAARAEAEPHVEALWHEARSLVYLFAYRLADQGFRALTVSAAVSAWAAKTEGLAPLRLGEVNALVLDGYAQGREDRLKSALYEALCEDLPVLRLAPGVVLACAAAKLDPEAARALADRVGRLMLRLEAKALIFDLSGLREPSEGVFLELLSVASTARMLGVTVITVGHDEGAAAARSESSIQTEHWVHARSHPEALALALGRTGQRLVEAGSLAGWIARIWPAAEPPPAAARRGVRG